MSATVGGINTSFGSSLYKLYQRTHHDTASPYELQAISKEDETNIIVASDKKILSKAYTIDNDGFFGLDFNKAVGIPENIKIPSKIAEIISQDRYSTGAETSTEKIVSNIWKMFQDVTKGNLDADNNGRITKDEYLKSMPTAVRYDKNGFIDTYKADDEVSIKMTRALSQVTRKNEDGLQVFNLGGKSNDELRQISKDTAGLASFDGYTVDSNGIDALKSMYKDFYETNYPNDKTNGSVSMGTAFGCFLYEFSTSFVQQDQLNCNTEANMSNMPNKPSGFKLKDEMDKMLEEMKKQNQDTLLSNDNPNSKPIKLESLLQELEKRRESEQNTNPQPKQKDNPNE